MLKQSSSRGGRGYKVTHVAQMCLILAVTVWMLYQVRHFYFKKAAAIDEGAKGVVKLGRKGMLPGVVEEEDEEEVKGEANEEEGGRVDEAENLMEESEDQETEDNQIEDGSFTNTKRNETDK